MGDYILGQIDYSGFELFIGAALSQDKKFIQDVNSTDIHAREAIRMYELDCDPSELKKKKFIFDGKEFDGGKDLRFVTKNSNVFATVYGASYLSEARDLRNIDCFIAFAKDKYKQTKTKLNFKEWFVSWSEEHVKYWQEEQFFKDYSGLKQWQDEEVKNFYKNGYVEFPEIGFRRYHPLDRNQIINTPTQGLASMVLLKGCIELNKRIKKEMRENNFKSRIIMTTHDDLTFRIYKPELYDLVLIANKIMLNPPFELCKSLKLKGEWSFGYSLYSLKEVNL